MNYEDIMLWTEWLYRQSMFIEECKLKKEMNFKWEISMDVLQTITDEVNVMLKYESPLEMTLRGYPVEIKEDCKNYIKLFMEIK